MVPTGPERLIWAQGDGSTLRVYDTPFNRISGSAKKRRKRRVIDLIAPALVNHPATAVAFDLLPHLRRVRDHIDRHYTEPLTLDQLAAVGAVSKFHLVRSFAAAYGETPIRYLTRRRVERAQDLLRAVNLTVSEVCFAVGFASIGSFSARFKQLVGETPTGYRDRWARTGAPHIPGCYLFMRGVVDLRTTSSVSSSDEEAQSRRSALPPAVLKS